MSNRRLKLVRNWPAVAAECGYQLQEIARKFGVSDRTVRRHIQTRFDAKPKEWLNELRARVAVQQLAKGESVKNVSKACHFAQTSSFTKFFKRMKGEIPTKYIASHPK
jgi:AraC-like DNA-binding protein